MTKTQRQVRTAEDGDFANTKPTGGKIIVAAMAKDGRRRAGLDIAHAGTILDLAEITEDQFNAILGDPQLTLRPYVERESEADKPA